MPIYEYRCKGCGHEYEQRRSMAAMDELSDCPECNTTTGERQVSMSFALVGVSRGGGDFDLGDLEGMEGLEDMAGMEGMGGMPPGMGGMPPGMDGF